MLEALSHRYRKREPLQYRFRERFFPRLPQPPGPFNVAVLDFELPAEHPECFGEFLTWKGKQEQLSLNTSAFALYYPTLVEGDEAKKYYRPRWCHPPVWIYAQGWVKACAIPPSISWFFSMFIMMAIYGIRLFCMEGAPLVPKNTQVHEEVTDQEEDVLAPERLPVIVFSHGLSGTPRLYSELCGAFASYGFIVCAIEHRDGTAPAVLLDPEKADDEKLPYRTRTVKTKKMQARNTYGYLDPPNLHLVGAKAPDWTDAEDATLILRRGQLSMRVREVEEALLVLKKLDDGDLEGDAIPFLGDEKGRPSSLDKRTAVLQQFKGRLDLTENIAMAGHSAGGATTIEVLRSVQDDSSEAEENLEKPKHAFKLGILLDPWTSPLPPPKREDIPSSFDAPYHPANPETLAPTPRGKLTVPLLSLNSSMFASWEDVSPYTKAVVEEAAANSGKGVSLEIHGSNHLAQSDFPLLFHRTFLWAPTSALTTSAARCMDINIKASLEFLREILPLSKLPLPAPGYECEFDRTLLKKIGIRRRHQKTYLSRRKERVLEGDAEEVIVQFKRL